MLDTSDLDFRNDLLRKSEEKKARALEATKKKRETLAKNREKYASTELFRQILEQLERLQTLIKLKQPPQPDVGPVKFVVNERDDDGNIKAFTVER